MPSGDAQRAWFPEMLDELRRFWDCDPDWFQIAGFCQEMTTLRAVIHSERGIKAPMMTCHNCGGKHAMKLTPLTPRSLLFALKKIEVINEEELKELDKQWKRFRSGENLDAYGQPKTNCDQLASRPSTCTDSKNKTS